MPKSLNEIRVMLQQTIQLPLSLILVITFRSTSFVIVDQEWTFHVFWGFVAFGFNCFFAGFSPIWYHEPHWLCLSSQILTLQTQIFVMIVCKSVIRSSNQMAWFAEVIPWSLFFYRTVGSRKPETEAVKNTRWARLYNRATQCKGSLRLAKIQSSGPYTEIDPDWANVHKLKLLMTEVSS